MPGQGWWVILRLYSLLEPFFTKEWRLIGFPDLASAINGSQQPARHASSFQL